MNNKVYINMNKRTDIDFDKLKDESKSVIGNTMSGILEYYFNSGDALQRLQNQINRVFPDMPLTFLLNNSDPGMIIKDMAMWTVRHHPKTWWQAWEKIEITRELEG